MPLFLTILDRVRSRPDPTLVLQHVTVTCIKGPPGPLRAEHSVLLMLALSRNLPTYLKNQQLHIWRREGQDWLPLHGQIIATLRVGSGGGNLARVCKNGFGMTVLGMTRGRAARLARHRRGGDDREGGLRAELRATRVRP